MNRLFTFLFFLMFIFSVKAQTTVKFQSFEGGADDWNFTASPVTFNSGGDVWATVASSFHTFGTIPSDNTSFWGIEDLNSPSGTADFGTLTFDAVDVSTYTSVTVTFDYEVDGYDNGDDMKYEIFHDAVSQGEVLFVDGSGNLNTDGTITLNVPDAVNTVSLVVSVKQNGGDQGGLDNFKVTGTSASTDTRVQFAASTSSIDEDGITIDVCASITNPDGANATTAEIALDGGSTATNGTDYDDGAGSPAAIVFPNTLTFPAGSSSNQCLSIFISVDDTAVEGNETVILNLQNAAGGNNAGLGSTTQHTLTIVDNDAPAIIISEVADPSDDFTARFVELFNAGSSAVILNGWKLIKYTNANPVPNNINIPNATLIPAGGYYVIGNNDVDFNAAYGFNPNLSSPSISGNGDDTYELHDGTSTVDIYGEVGVDGTGQAWEYLDDIVFRNATITTGNTTWAVGEWTFIAPGNVSDATPGAATLLPIKLQSFTAIKKANTTLLQWQTATEINNDYMVIERSHDGRTFTAIGQVQGAGTTYEVNNYSFIDEKPSAGVNYYRLRQVDYDGKVQIHRTISVVFGKDNSTVQVFPTEVAAAINVVFPTTTTAKTELVVVDVTGKEWLRTILSTGQSQYTLDVSSLVSGQFFLRVQSESGLEVARFVKL